MQGLSVNKSVATFGERIRVCARRRTAVSYTHLLFKFATHLEIVIRVYLVHELSINTSHLILNFLLKVISGLLKIFKIFF